MAKRQKMFRPGERVADVAAVERAMMDGRWLYWCDRPKHPGVIASMSLHTIHRAIFAGIIRYAERNDAP